MLREHSIVLSQESPNYRKVAQEHWGLTDEQMIGMHVHHHPSRSQGGRNIPEHLYVCSESTHYFGWHNADPRLSMTPYASAAGRVSGRKQYEQSTGLFSRSKEKLSEDCKRGALAVQQKLGPLLGLSPEQIQAKNKKSIETQRVTETGWFSMTAEEKTERSQKAASNTNSQLWEDPNHPELGTHSPGTLVQMQKRRSLPHGKENRKRCTQT